MSALTGYSISDFLQVARDLDSRMNKTLATSALNKVIGDMGTSPPAKKIGKDLIFYAVQVENRPFRIRLFCNRKNGLMTNIKGI